ncbi:MAG: hypothetical protein JWO03_1477 [Bacteroidetes bacterium]|nr:hypothetical protein [Bacteroidota bacterium]
MTTTDYTTTLLVDQSPKEVFHAINNVSNWWTAAVEGSTEKLNDIFTVHFGETFITSKVTELIPGQKIVWHVTDCNKHWLKNKKEWVGTTMTWEISQKDSKTQIHFTHEGLVPTLECYGGCSNAWDEYIKDSLYKLLTEGVGMPS